MERLKSPFFFWKSSYRTTFTNFHWSNYKCKELQILYETKLPENLWRKKDVPVHKLDKVDLEFVSVHLGELFEGEGPAVETGTETDGTLAGVNTDLTWMNGMDVGYIGGLKRKQKANCRT